MFRKQARKQDTHLPRQAGWWAVGWVWAAWLEAESASPLRETHNSNTCLERVNTGWSHCSGAGQMFWVMSCRVS